MLRKSTFAVLATALIAAATMRELQLSKLATDLKLTPAQVKRVDKLLDDLDILRKKIVKASAGTDQAATAAAKEAFRTRQESGFHGILTPEQFLKWKEMNTPPANPQPHHHPK